MRLDITCSTDDNYVQYCMALLCSVYENNKEHNIYIHLLHDGLSDASIEQMEILTKRYHKNIFFMR